MFAGGLNLIDRGNLHYISNLVVLTTPPKVPTHKVSSLTKSKSFRDGN